MKIARIAAAPCHIFNDWTVEIYVCGCRQNCPGCHNKSLQDFDCSSGKEMTVYEIVAELLKRKELCNSVTYLGGDFSYFPDEYAYISEQCHRIGFKNILYSGHSQGQLPPSMLRFTDLTLYGRYDSSDPGKLNQARERLHNGVGAGLS